MTTMLAVVARHERRVVAADRALVAGLVVFLVLAVYALVSGARWQDARDADARLAETQSIERNAGFGKDAARYEAGETLVKPSWYRAWITAPTSPDARVALPSRPLAAISSNAGELQPLAASMRAGSSRFGLLDDHAASTENPASLATGRFDGVFLLVAILPLLLLGATYDLLSAERESGTLALVMTQPVHLTTVALGKALVRGAAVLGPAIAIVVAGFLVVRGAGAGAGGAWADLGLLVLVVAAYGVFWIALAALVNAFGGSSSANALVLGGLWLAFVVAIPSLLGVVTTAVHPPPDRAELTNAIRATLVASRAKGNELLGDWNQQHPERPITETGGPADGFDNPKATLTTWLVRERADALLAPVAGAFEARLDAQQRLAGRWRWLSPALVVEQALERLAGTDVARSRAFRDATRAHLDRMRALLVPKILAGEKLRAADYERLPRFAMTEPDARGHALRDAAVVAAVAAALAVVAAAALRHARIRD